MKYTKIPESTFEEIQLNAGILCTSFTPSSGEFEGLLGATSGGINFQATPTFSDMGEDIDNCPKNTMELKKLDFYEVTMSGSFVTLTAETVAKAIGAADVATGKVTPRGDLTEADFSDLWWIGDYSNKNTGASAGYVAIHMMNVLSTGGFQIQTNDKAKGQMSFEFMAHYSIEDQEKVPFEVYVKKGT